MPRAQVEVPGQDGTVSSQIGGGEPQPLTHGIPAPHVLTRRIASPPYIHALRQCPLHSTTTFTVTVMDTIEQLDTDINDLHTRIATLRAHHANLASILLSQPHLATRLQRGDQRDKSAENAQRLIKQQSKRNLENIYRACAGVTAYKVQDPDPHAISNGNILGVAIDVSIGGKFIETYHVLLNFKERQGESNKVLRIHKHTIPPYIPLQQLANKWLPTSSKDVENATNPDQDLVRFGRSLRKELVAWHMRVQAVEDLRREAGLPSSRIAREEQGPTGGVESTGRILNAFVSDDDGSSDVEEAEDEDDGIVRILDIESDAAIRQITVSWSDGRTSVMNITKDGRVEKAVCRARGGGRDVARSRKAIGPLGGLVQRLMA
ncbi:Nn.00g038250.m01.CDS01 [Neocucurbitaria sp. VM-36]